MEIVAVSSRELRRPSGGGMVYPGTEEETGAAGFFRVTKVSYRVTSSSGLLEWRYYEALRNLVNLCFT